MKKLMIIAALFLTTGILDAKEIKKTDSTSIEAVDKPIMIEAWMLQPDWLNITETEITVQDAKQIKMESFEDTPIQLENWMMKPLVNTEEESVIEIQEWMKQPLK